MPTRDRPDQQRLRSRSVTDAELLDAVRDWLPDRRWFPAKGSATELARRRRPDPHRPAGRGRGPDPARARPLGDRRHRPAGPADPAPGRRHRVRRRGIRRRPPARTGSARSPTAAAAARRRRRPGRSCGRGSPPRTGGDGAPADLGLDTEHPRVHQRRAVEHLGHPLRARRRRDPQGLPRPDAGREPRRRRPAAPRRDRLDARAAPARLARRLLDHRRRRGVRQPRRAQRVRGGRHRRLRARLRHGGARRVVRPPRGGPRPGRRAACTSRWRTAVPVDDDGSGGAELAAALEERFAWAVGSVPELSEWSDAVTQRLVAGPGAAGRAAAPAGARRPPPGPGACARGTPGTSSTSRASRSRARRPASSPTSPCATSPACCAPSTTPRRWRRAARVGRRGAVRSSCAATRRRRAWRRTPTSSSSLELDKALYEAVYEARNRPQWRHIPAAALTRLLGGDAP